MEKAGSVSDSADSSSFSMAQFHAGLKAVCIPLSSVADVAVHAGPLPDVKTLIDEPGNRLTVSTSGGNFHIEFGGTPYCITPTDAMPYKYLQVILGSTLFRWVMEQGSPTGAALAAAPIMPTATAGSDIMILSLRMADELRKALAEGNPMRIRGTLQNLDEIAAEIYGFPRRMVPKLQGERR